MSKLEKCTDLPKKDYLGKVKAHSSGVAHRHILLIMDEQSKPKQPEQIDHTVYAKIPDEATNPLLSLRYDAHLNCEGVSVEAVKYLYKYITKGADFTVRCGRPDQHQVMMKLRHSSMHGTSQPAKHSGASSSIQSTTRSQQSKNYRVQ